MSFTFNASLSGLNANSNALNVVGNNIANANTIGFRSSAITFADVYANSNGVRLNGAGSTLQTGDGVRTAAIQTNFTQGSLNESGSGLHAAIQGNGFFVVRNIDGTSAYTRAGDFTVDKQGYVITPNGSQVQGYGVTNGAVQQGSALTSLKLPIGQTLAPQISTSASLKINLNSATATGATFHAPMQVYDSRGKSRTMDITFTKLADGSFDATATLDGHPAQLAANGGSASNAPVNFTFDVNGNSTSPAQLAVIPDQTQLDGAVLPSIDVKMRETNADGTPGAFNIVSYAKDSAVSATNTDGYASGELNGAAIGPDGQVLGIFSNGQTRPVGQIALATFNSQEGLARIGGNMFTETLASNQATIGAPATGGRGSIAGGYLEQSNVNITNEFVKLIEAQRGFQANSRVITSLNQTFQDLLQII